jgi:hypothetical protein
MTWHSLAFVHPKGYVIDVFLLSFDIICLGTGECLFEDIRYPTICENRAGW